ncbi:hypothetical protein [Natronorubrum sulfidifaciens]|uniref:Uncharacterized protein n=1 Tax=Natronorubrum sulfidifaciens JCM 14089 TaxID=1230460 RepID=L9WG75_9EURY|nr:hypothetical protein [Natronorubrum sulfidifaciens]ELY47328.1 hypothetical protein C495_03682 [Natronorubrum sulfidifaciens JCM 14089]
MKSYILSFQNGIERETSITYFIEKALEDPEAMVIDPETGMEVSEPPVTDESAEEVIA